MKNRHPFIAFLVLVLFIIGGWICLGILMPSVIGPIASLLEPITGSGFGSGYKLGLVGIGCWFLAFLILEILKTK